MDNCTAHLHTPGALQWATVLPIVIPLGHPRGQMYCSSYYPWSIPVCSCNAHRTTTGASQWAAGLPIVMPLGIPVGRCTAHRNAHGAFQWAGCPAHCNTPGASQWAAALPIVRQPGHSNGQLCCPSYYPMGIPVDNCTAQYCPS